MFKKLKYKILLNRVKRVKKDLINNSGDIAVSTIMISLNKLINHYMSKLY